jgi:hypothetical protein
MNSTEFIQVRMKKSDYDKIVKYGRAGEPVHQAVSRMVELAEKKRT